MDWDEMMEEVEESTSDIDKGIVGTIDLERLGSHDARGKFASKESKEEYWKGLTSKLTDDEVVEKKVVREVVEEGSSGEFAGMSDKQIVDSFIKPKVESKRGNVDNFNTKQERSMKWLPKESLISYNIAKERRARWWIVKALVLIRDDGRCRVCGELVKGQTWKVLKEDKELGMEESNCFLVCKDCALCHMYKEMSGSGRLERFKNMKLFVLKRRMKGVKKCGKLLEFGMTSLVLLARDKSASEGKLDSRLVRNEVRRIAREKSAFG
jgi:hypothetical protein